VEQFIVGVRGANINQLNNCINQLILQIIGKKMYQLQTFALGLLVLLTKDHHRVERAPVVPPTASPVPAHVETSPAPFIWLPWTEGLVTCRLPIVPVCEGEVIDLGSQPGSRMRHSDFAAAKPIVEENVFIRRHDSDHLCSTFLAVGVVFLPVTLFLRGLGRDEVSLDSVSSLLRKCRRKGDVAFSGVVSIPIIIPFAYRFANLAIRLGVLPV